MVMLDQKRFLCAVISAVSVQVVCLNELTFSQSRSVCVCVCGKVMEDRGHLTLMNCSPMPRSPSLAVCRLQMCVWNNNVIWQTPAISVHGSDIQMSGRECVRTAGIKALSEDERLLFGKAGVCVCVCFRQLLSVSGDG